MNKKLEAVDFTAFEDKKEIITNEEEIDIDNLQNSLMKSIGMMEEIEEDDEFDEINKNNLEKLRKFESLDV